MATIPSQRTWVVGEVVTAAYMNSNIRDSVNFLIARPYCNAYNAAGFSTTSGTTTLVPLDTEVEDNDGMHSNVTNNSRIIANTIGAYRLCAAADWPSNGTGFRSMQIRMNAAGASGGGSFICIRQATPFATGSTTVMPVIEGVMWRTTNAGDYFELFCAQNSGGALTVPGGQTGCYMSVMWELA